MIPQSLQSALPTASRRRREEAAQRPIASALALDGSHVLSINESHERCATLGLSRIGAPDFSPIPRADFAVARERNRRLFAHASPVMEMLFDQVAKTQSMVVLTDAQGTILHSIGDVDFVEKAATVALAVWRANRARRSASSATAERGVPAADNRACTAAGTSTTPPASKVATAA